MANLGGAPVPGAPPPLPTPQATSHVLSVRSSVRLSVAHSFRTRKQDKRNESGVNFLRGRSNRFSSLSSKGQRYRMLMQTSRNCPIMRPSYNTV